MRLWSGNSIQFYEDVTRNQIAEKLKNSFFDYFRFNPSPQEVNSWRNSLRALSISFQNADLNDHGIILEYQLPLTSQRLDCLVCGRDAQKKDNAVIVELKQWEKCEESNAQNEVVTWMGGGLRDVLHPSVQVGQYHRYLEDTHTAFYEGHSPIKLNSCTYLHNYNYYSEDVIFSNKFKKVIEQYPLFTADDTKKLENYLSEKLESGSGIEVLKRIENSKYRPSKKLMDHVGNLIKGKTEYILLDEQLIVFDKVLAAAKEGFHNKQKTVIIVKGGPGTGKSVIAINLMSELLLNGYNAHYATGSKAFTQTLRKIIGSRGSVQFKYFNSYGQAKENEVDVLISDEAHRIRKTSNSRFTKRELRTDLPQVEELLKAAKVPVFFIDDNQIVRPTEIGSVQHIKEYAEQYNAKVFEYELEAQFRCNGSEAFVNWINNTLGIKRTANVIWDQHEEFDFKIFESPFELEKAIKAKVAEGHTGRVSAGFCWDWSKPKNDGTLSDDVVIGDYKRPWDAKPGSTRLAPGIPKAELWAYEPNGINQIGCVYTAQGFEFDYIGVIIGKDLIYDFDKQDWIGIRENSADTVVKRSREKFEDLIKNTYRVLLSRGMKGCYVYFMDKDTERFFKSRIEHLKPEKSTEEEMPQYELQQEVEEKKKYKEYLPVYSLQAAASAFSGNQYVECLGWRKINTNNAYDQNYFIAKVIGSSMEPTIPNNSFCIFKKHSGGSRDNLVVLVECNEIQDPENGQQYTIKRYTSEKEMFEDGTWRHKKIVLKPDNKEFQDLILKDIEPVEFKVVAEFVSVLKE